MTPTGDLDNPDSLQHPPDPLGSGPLGHRDWDPLTKLPITIVPPTVQLALSCYGDHMRATPKHKLSNICRGRNSRKSIHGQCSLQRGILHSSALPNFKDVLWFLYINISPLTIEQWSTLSLWRELYFQVKWEAHYHTSPLKPAQVVQWNLKIRAALPERMCFLIG